MIYFEKDEEAEKKIKEVKEQEAYFGDFPMMTDRGSFIINGAERVIVSQLHKSPGVFFKNDSSRTASNKPSVTAQILPQRGSWINFEFDSKDIFFTRFDKKPKFFATIFLKALGYNEEEIISRFYASETIFLDQAQSLNSAERKYFKSVEMQSTLNQQASYDILDPHSSQVIVPKGRKINKGHLRKMEAAGIKRIEVSEDDLIGRFLYQTIYDEKGGVLALCNHQLTQEALDALIASKVTSFKVIYIGNRTIGNSLRDTLAIDKVQSTEEALLEVYRRMRPGDLPLLEIARYQLYNMFFNPDRYDLSVVGRMKMNRKLGLNVDPENRVLSKDDILEVVSYLLKLKENIGTIDDIDHLSNRRVKGVGELIENRFRVGLARMEKVIKERMSLHADSGINISDVVNAKPLVAVVTEFFGSSQLSQFMDQTNPLSEIAHKRRLSALGPGGLARDRAGFEVRDVHNSHYGKICPVETPEGPNIGLISSLACFSKVNSYGFVETPYRKIKDGKVTKGIEYLSAFDDDKAKIVQPDFLAESESSEFVSARVDGDFRTIHRSEADYMDLSPKQLVSVASSLVPFLEHDDANRALMGSNMQRQAVPVVKPEAPLVGTGMEFQVARDSATCVIAKQAGIVESVDSSRIVISTDDNADAKDISVDIYHLDKYGRSNQNTCVNHRPLVKAGMLVHKGQIIADGASTESGELALGQNVLVAFMPWNGYNYEDSILVSERVLAEDRFTSVHIEGA